MQTYESSSLESRGLKKRSISFSVIVVCTLSAILCWKQQGFSGNDFYLRMVLTLFLLVLVLCFLLTPLLPSFLLFNYFLWRPPYLLITKLTCLWFPTNCRLRSLAVSLKAFACFSRIRILHAFELSFLSAASNRLYEPMRQKQSWKTAEDIQYSIRAVSHHELLEKKLLCQESRAPVSSRTAGRLSGSAPR